MRIHRLCLQNWGQHTALEVTLPPTGVTSLTGPNNSGKSTLLSAIGWVLSPSSRNRYGDRNDIQDGCTNASVTLEFTLEDDFHQPRKHILRKQIRLPDNPNQKSIPETTIQLNGEILSGPQWEQFLSADAHLGESGQFLSLMIAPQEEIHALLRAPLGTRNKELRENLGIALPDIWGETLKEEVANWAQTYAHHAGAIERALTDSETRLQELHSAEQTYQLKLSELPQPETVTEQIAEIEQTIQQLKLHQEKQLNFQELLRELQEAETEKRMLRAQAYPGLPPQGDYSELELPQAKRRLRLLSLAECQQRAKTARGLFEQAQASSVQSWPLSIQEKEALRFALQTQQAQLDKYIIEQEFVQHQIAKLQAEINPQYTPLEAEAEALDSFWQTAAHHTRLPDLIHLRKIPLREVKQNYEQELATAAASLNQAKKERQTLRTEQNLDPFTGTEAADTLIKLWNNRTPEQRCILTGADLSHLAEDLVTQTAESFRALPLVAGSMVLTISSEHQTHLPGLARLTELNQHIGTLEQTILNKQTVLGPLIQALDTLPSDKWFKISIEAIGTCLTQMRHNLACRRQIHQYQGPQPLATSLEQTKKEQSNLNEQIAQLAQAIQLQAALSEIERELTTKLELTESNNFQQLPATNGRPSLEVNPSPEFGALVDLPPEELNIEIDNLDRTIRAEEQIRENTDACERKIEAIKRNLEITQSALANLESALTSAHIDLQQPAELEKQKGAAAESLKTIQQLQALKAQNEQHLQQTLANHQRLQKEQQEIQAEKENLEAAKEAADFFAPRRAPKQLLRAALQEIVEETNRILPETGLEIELSVNPEMDFEVSFERAQKRITEPARRLGCGLATLVGMCLKMALARVLQPNLKFLAFDEPSAQLDALKKEAFCLFLKTLSRQALTGNQILVIEHDLAIAESCDCQIRLT